MSQYNNYEYADNRIPSKSLQQQSNFEVIDLEEYYQNKRQTSSNCIIVDYEYQKDDSITIDEQNNNSHYQSHRKEPQLQKKIEKGKHNSNNYSEKYIKQHKKVKYSEKLSKSVLDSNKPINMKFRKSIDSPINERLINETNEKKYLTSIGNSMNKNFITQMKSQSEDVSILDNYGRNMNYNTKVILRGDKYNLQEEDNQSIEKVGSIDDIDLNQDNSYFRNNIDRRETQNNVQGIQSNIIVIEDYKQDKKQKRDKRENNSIDVQQCKNNYKITNNINRTKSGNFMNKIFFEKNRKYQEGEQILESYNSNSNNNTKSIFDDIMAKIQLEDPHLLQNDQPSGDKEIEIYNYDEHYKQNNLKSRFLNDEQKQKMMDQSRKQISNFSDVQALEKRSPFMNNNYQINQYENQQSQRQLDEKQKLNSLVELQQQESSYKNRIINNPKNTNCQYQNEYLTSKQNTRPQQNNYTDVIDLLLNNQQIPKQNSNKMNQLEKCFQLISDYSTKNNQNGQKFIIKVKRPQQNLTFNQQRKEDEDDSIILQKSNLNNSQETQSVTFKQLLFDNQIQLPQNIKQQNYLANENRNQNQLIQDLSNPDEFHNLVQQVEQFKREQLNTTKYNIQNSQKINESGLKQDAQNLLSPTSLIINESSSIQNDINFSSPIKNQITFISHNVFSPDDTELNIKYEYQNKIGASQIKQSEDSNKNNLSAQVLSFIPIPSNQTVIQMIVEDDQEPLNDYEINSCDIIIEEDDNQQQATSINQVEQQKQQQQQLKEEQQQFQQQLIQQQLQQLLIIKQQQEQLEQLKMKQQQLLQLQQQQTSQQQQQQQLFNSKNLSNSQTKLNSQPKIVNTFFHTKQDQLNHLQELNEEELYSQFQQFQNTFRSQNMDNYFK